MASGRRDRVLTRTPKITGTEQRGYDRRDATATAAARTSSASAASPGTGVSPVRGMPVDDPGAPVPPETVGSGAGGGSVIAPADGVADGATDADAETDAVADGDADAEAEGDTVDVAVADALGPGAADCFPDVVARTSTVTNPTVMMTASAIRMTSTVVAPREDSTVVVDRSSPCRSKIIEA